jgi:DNA-binding beta-propeller fold protein YncE
MTRLFVVSVKNSIIEIYDLKTEKKVGEINVPDQPHEIEIDSHQHLAYVTIPYRQGIYGQYIGEGHEIVIIDLNQNKVKGICDLSPNHCKPHGMQIGQKSGYLYVSCESNNGEILKMDTKNDLKVNLCFYNMLIFFCIC